MMRFTIPAFLAVVMFLSAAHAGEKFECLHCYAGKTTLLHESNDLAPVVTYSLDGLIMSKSENKFLDNASTHCTGLWRGIISTPEVKIINYCVTVDPDGDMLIWGSPEAGGLAKQNLLEGTGKYKGIKGSLMSEVTGRAKRPVKPGTFQQCRLFKGEFELPQK